VKSLALPAYAQLSDADEAALTDLYRRGTPPNTLRAWERDLAYIAAWKMASFGRTLDWPEDEKVALRFILDHAQGLTERPGTAQDVVMELIAIGLRKDLTCPARATLDRRIASWQAFHRMRNLVSPFSAPLVQQARQKARRANARPRVQKSPKPITKDILEALIATCDGTIRGARDRAMLMLAFASGGRRRSEVTALNVEDIGLDDFASKGLVWIVLLETKTTKKGSSPTPANERPCSTRPCPLAGGYCHHSGPAVSTGVLVCQTATCPAASHRTCCAPSCDTGWCLRAGFLTQAALDGASVAAAIKLSLHRSAVQAQKYYADVEISENPATDLLGD
jgi:hypothetical protein